MTDTEMDELRDKIQNADPLLATLFGFRKRFVVQLYNLLAKTNGELRQARFDAANNSAASYRAITFLSDRLDESPK